MPENKKPQNPSAFPAWDMTFGKNPNTDLYSAGTGQGMSLRDYFAAKAMQSLLSTDGTTQFETRAREAYEVADAMLKQREL